MSKTFTPRERISKARISLLTDQPFFGALAMRMVVREFTEEEAKQVICKTMAVDNYGNLMYYAPFVMSLSDNDLKFVVCHEVMHLALEHIIRKGTRHPKTWNVAIDSAANYIIKQTYAMPQDVIDIPEMYGKSAEETYDYLIKDIKRLSSYGKAFDNHVEGGSKESQDVIDSPYRLEGQELFDGQKAVKEAADFARQRGKLPGGIEKLFKNLLAPVINWKDILQRYLVALLPTDYSYTSPSKRSMGSGVYLPRITRENIEVVIGLDTSGSVGVEEYSEFLSEIYSITKQFDNLKATVICADAKVHEVIEIDGNFDPYRFKSTGGGGTESQPVYDYVETKLNKDNVKALVYFTDGYIGVPRKPYPFHTLWVISSSGSVESVCKMENSTTIQMPKP